ncbi:MAG TPA: TIGR01459 family HAD-type hydrolase [Caulobacteraceae bacterium]|nr:TIGR01459 family HAD-type hydrolase [Caulobacteraceae bacterium]
MTALPAGLSEIADRYDALLCDVWGVIHNGRESFPDALDALVRWKAERGPVVLISNAPRPAVAIHAQLERFKVPTQAWTAFVTSGDATRTLLAERAPGPCWSIGPARDAPLYDGLGLAFADAEDAAFVCVTGPYDDETETPEDYRGRFEVAVERGLEMICANPDRVVQRGDKLIYCGGSLADLYEDMGGRVLMAGKPYAPIYDLALHETGDVDPARVLCIGDGVITDVKGAADHNLDCLFIARGIHGEAAMHDGRLDAAAVEVLLAEEGVTARYAMSDLVW